MPNLQERYRAVGAAMSGRYTKAKVADAILALGDIQRLESENPTVTSVADRNPATIPVTKLADTLRLLFDREILVTVVDSDKPRESVGAVERLPNGMMSWWAKASTPSEWVTIVPESYYD